MARKKRRNRDERRDESELNATKTFYTSPMPKECVERSRSGLQ